MFSRPWGEAAAFDYGVARNYGFDWPMDQTNSIDEIVSERCDDEWALDKLESLVSELENVHETDSERVDAAWLSIREFLHVLRKIHRTSTYGKDFDEELNSFYAEWIIRAKLSNAIERVELAYCDFRVTQYFNDRLLAPVINARMYVS